MEEVLIDASAEYLAWRSEEVGRKLEIGRKRKRGKTMREVGRERYERKEKRSVPSKLRVR